MRVITSSFIITTTLIFASCSDDQNSLSTEESSSSVSTISSSSVDLSSSSNISSSSSELASSSSTLTEGSLGPGQKLIPAQGVTFQMGEDLATIYASATNTTESVLFKNLIMDNGTLEGVEHTVTFSKSFYMDTTEVTQEQLIATLSQANETDAVSAMESFWESAHSAAHMPIGNKYPAMITSPLYIALYANARSAKEGLTAVYTINKADGSFSTNYNANGYRLPTEAEWEYAARGGANTHFYWNKDFTMPLSIADSNLISEYAIWKINSSDLGAEIEGYGPHEVATKLPNGYGLYDMVGNLSEFINAAWNWVEYPAEPVTDPQDNSTLWNELDYLHKRGGNWMNEAMFLRVTNRTYHSSAYKEFGVGFRLVRVIE